MNGDPRQEILQTEQWQVGSVLQVKVQHASNADSKKHCRERRLRHGSGAEERDSGHTLEWKEAIIQRIASHCNDKKLAAKRVSEASDEMFLASFIKECGPYNVEGIVLKV